MKAHIHWSTVICRRPGRYLAWPTIARREDGELLVVFSGEREEHACPYGKTQLIRSADDGVTWSEPVTIADTPLDVRDAGILVLRSGVIVVSSFTVPTWSRLDGFRKTYPAEQVDGWQRYLDTVSHTERQRWLGNWTRRSTDGGCTWEEPVDSIASAPHGPIQLRDGRLLFLGVDAPGEPPYRLLAVESVDEGRSWRRIGTVPLSATDHAVAEPHPAELPDGRLVCLWRYQPEELTEHRYLRQTESDDGGRTWTETHATAILGYPAHLLTLRSGALLATYGRRVPPMGHRACLSHDGGASWDSEQEIVLRDDAPDVELPWPASWDLGYPATVELAAGELLTVYYQIAPSDLKPSIHATRWSLR